MVKIIPVCLTIGGGLRVFVLHVFNDMSRIKI
jgi:hypothetical protein